MISGSREKIRWDREESGVRSQEIREMGEMGKQNFPTPNT
jgi:hypothetical protein